MDEVIAYFYPSEESHHNFQYSNALLLQEMATTASGITPQERLPAQPMAIHSGLRRKHRKNAGTRLSPKVSAALRAYNAIDRNCNCGKKCLETAVETFGVDAVLDCIKYCQSKVFNIRYEEKYLIMRLKLESKFDFELDTSFCLYLLHI